MGPHQARNRSGPRQSAGHHEARRGVVLTLVASVITGYVTLLDLDSRLQVAEETLAGRNRVRGAVPKAARRRLDLGIRDVPGSGGI